MNFRQSRRVTKRGLDREKTTRNLMEALFVSIFILCLFLTGCSVSLNGAGDRGSSEPIVLVGGEATLPAPPTEEALAATTEPASQPEAAPVVSEEEAAELAAVAYAEALKVPETNRAKLEILDSMLKDDQVQRRVATVIGWLKFVRQRKSEVIIGEALKRVQSGKILGPLRFEPQRDYPDLAIPELMLWRQLVLTDESALTVSVERQLEVLVRTLATATRPDDLQHADRFLPEGYASPVTTSK